VAATLIGVATMMLAGCSSNGVSSHLRIAGDDSPAWAAMPNVAVNTPWVFATFSLCVDHGSAQVTNVSTVKANGPIKVVDWGVRVRSSGDGLSSGNGDPGAAPGMVSKLPGFTHGSVKVKCTDKARAVEFDVDVQSAAPQVTTTDGILVRYKAGGGTGSITVPFRISLCPKKCPNSVLG
jgi:hypothetical protein